MASSPISSFISLPEPFYKDVIQCPATPIHADGNAVRLEYAGKSLAGKLMKLLMGLLAIRLSAIKHALSRWS